LCIAVNHVGNSVISNHCFRKFSMIQFWYWVLLWPFWKSLCLHQTQSYCPQLYCFWNTGTGDQYLYVVQCVHLLVHINRSMWGRSGWEEMLSSQKLNRHWGLLKMRLWKYIVWARLWHIVGYEILQYTVSQWVSDKFRLYCHFLYTQLVVNRPIEFEKYGERTK